MQNCNCVFIRSCHETTWKKLEDKTWSVCSSVSYAFSYRDKDNPINHHSHFNPVAPDMNLNISTDQAPFTILLVRQRPTQRTTNLTRCLYFSKFTQNNTRTENRFPTCFLQAAACRLIVREGQCKSTEAN